MTLSLSAQFDELIRRKLSSGLYESATQVVEEALQLLEERDVLRDFRRERLLREIARGVSEADNRQFIDSTQVFRGLIKKATASDE
jgi:antitoxin ParD1/3/4